MIDDQLTYLEVALLQTINHSFTSSGLTSIMVLGSSLSMPLSMRRLVPPHLRHRVGGTFIYKSERYSVGRISGMIRDDKEEQESDDKNLEG